MKIYCPKCNRVLGDTKSDFEGNLNCKNCKTVHVNVLIAK